jgi:hypothetical protein
MKNIARGLRGQGSARLSSCQAIQILQKSYPTFHGLCIASNITQENCLSLSFGRFLPTRTHNTIEAWLDHGLLGTQLGPNKNGRKW